MILTDDDIWKNDDIMAANSGYGANFETLRELIRAVESALLEKLRGGVEVPEPVEYVEYWNDRADMRWTAPAEDDYFTRDQLLQYGASQRLAGREQAIEECALKMESQHAWLTNIAAANLIRALAASPQEQI